VAQSSDRSDQIRTLLDLAKLGQREDAERELDHIAGAEPHNVAVWVALAQVSSTRQKAIHCLEQVLRLEPDHQDAAQALSRLADVADTASLVLDEPRSALNFRFSILSAIAIVLLLLFLGLAAKFRGGTSVWHMQQNIADPAVTRTPVPAPTPTTLPNTGKLAVESETQYYSVTGTTVSDLQASLIANRPPGSKDIWAYTQTSFSFEIVTEHDSQECWINDIVVRLKLRTMYPKWEPSGAPTLEATYAWEPFIDALVRHEEHHATIANEIGHRYLTTLRTLPPAPTCNTLAASISTALASVEAEGLQRQVDWDEEEGILPFPIP
jgi:predicted secreted Zn-dependent protease